MSEDQLSPPDFRPVSCGYVFTGPRYQTLTVHRPRWDCSPRELDSSEHTYETHLFDHLDADGLRGGWIVDSIFYAIGGGGAVYDLPVKDVRELKLTPYSK